MLMRAIIAIFFIICPFCCPAIDPLHPVHPPHPLHPVHYSMGKYTLKAARESHYIKTRAKMVTTHVKREISESVGEEAMGMIIFAGTVAVDKGFTYKSKIFERSTQHFFVSPDEIKCVFRWSY